MIAAGIIGGLIGAALVLVLLAALWISADGLD